VYTAARQREVARAVSESSRSLLRWIVGVLAAAALAILSMIFVMDIYLALQETTEPVSIQGRR
jgi:hypothetical protein